MRQYAPIAIVSMSMNKKKTMSKEGRCYFMKYKSEILEMARIACATVPDDLCDQMDISDDFFTEIRDYIRWETSDPSHEVIFNRAKAEETK
tara:strand:+ start:983 stop:1255 length:273 start_codon:yes stop_codon:yes gene_type:complete